MRLVQITRPLYLKENIQYNPDILFKDVLDNISGNESEYWIHEWLYKNRRDPYEVPHEELVGIINDLNFQEWLRDEIEGKAMEIEWDLNRKIKDGFIIGTRAIHVQPNPRVWINQMLTGKGRNLGEYWSHQEGSEDAHWGTGGFFMVIYGKIPVDGIVWQRTLEVNITAEDEKELYVAPGTPIEILGIKARSTSFDPSGYIRKGMVWLNIGNLKGMKFPA